jgi:hypothetical protein
MNEYGHWEIKYPGEDWEKTTAFNYGVLRIQKTEQELLKSIQEHVYTDEYGVSFRWVLD